MRMSALCVILFSFALSFSTCVNRAQQQNQEKEGNVTISVEDDISMLDVGHIISLIKEDEEKRNVWSYDFKQTSSPLFYEAICDDGLYLYRVITDGHKSFVMMIEDSNISYHEDYIVGNTDTSGVVYKHKGYYEIIDDSTVKVVFDEWYSNYCNSNDSEIITPIYHVRGEHHYKLSDMAWTLAHADTTILLDEKQTSFCGDIWK